MPEFDKMLVVGFDGLDYRKIQKYDCNNIMLQSFGKLDTQGLALKTPMLWASIITGKSPGEHGIDDMLAFKGDKARKLDDLMDRFFGFFGKSGLHLRKTLNYYLYDDSISVPDKNYMETDSIFEKVADSKAFDVPGYSEYPYISGKMNVAKLSRKNPPVSRKRVKRDIDAEHLYRKEQLFENIGKHTLLMQHFHYSDWHQHMYLSEEKDKQLYKEMDELAGKILEKADDDTLVVFCSDHGLEDGGHRDEAFFSVNTDIDENQSITTLLESCLEHVDYKNKEETVESIEV